MRHYWGQAADERESADRKRAAEEAKTQGRDEFARMMAALETMGPASEAKHSE